jgi:membrane protein
LFVIGSAALQATPVNDKARHNNENDFIICRPHCSSCANVPSEEIGSSGGALGEHQAQLASGCGVSSQQGIVRARISAVSRFNRPVFKKYWGLIKRVSDEADEDDADIVAAGLAFYGTLGLFPALLAMVSLYGLIADPIAIQHAIYSVARSLPPAARDLVTGELSSFIARDSRSLSAGMVLGFLAVLWSASSAMSVLVRAINVAYDIPERRSFFKRRRLAVLFTLAGMLGLFVLIPLTAVLPKLLTFFHIESALVLLRWPAMLALAWLTFGLLYRYAAQKSPLPTVKAVFPGAGIAALLWVGLCAVYSAYVQYFTNFTSTYGALTGVIVLQFWLYISALITVYGAELNAELVRHPLGQEQQDLPHVVDVPADPEGATPRGVEPSPKGSG